MEPPLDASDPDPDTLPAAGEGAVGAPVTVGTGIPGSTGGPARPTIPFAALIGAAGVAVLAVGLLVALFTGGEEASGADLTIDELAGYGFVTDDGGTGTLADYAGQPMVVNFFASWCPPCRAEMPDLEAAHLANADVTFLGVNHDFDEEIWRSFVDESAITYETVFQPDTELFTALEAVGMPSTALIDADGEVVFLHTGILTESMLQDLIDEHLVPA